MPASLSKKKHKKTGNLTSEVCLFKNYEFQNRSVNYRLNPVFKPEGRTSERTKLARGREATPKRTGVGIKSTFGADSEANL